MSKPCAKLPNRRRRVRRSDPLDGLKMRLTYRTVRVLMVIGEQPGATHLVQGEGGAHRSVAGLLFGGALDPQRPGVVETRHQADVAVVHPVPAAQGTGPLEIGLEDHVAAGDRFQRAQQVFSAPTNMLRSTPSAA